MRSLVLIAALALLSPSLASAQEGIVPSCDTAGSGSGYDCQLADIVVLAQNILTFIIVFAVILAGLLFAYAGLLLATDRGNEQNRRKATSIFWSAIIGLIVVLTAWLIVNTLLSLLTRGDLKFWTDNIRRATVPPPQEVVPPWDTNPRRAGHLGVEGAGGSGEMCSPMASGICSVEALTPIFGSGALVASRICGRESGGNPTVQPTTDILWDTQDGFSFGLFQINLVGHNITCGGRTLNCSGAFTRRPEYSQCVCNTSVSQPESCYRTETWGGREVRVNAACGYGYSITDRPLYESCRAAAQDATCNLDYARNLYETRGWRDWAGGTCRAF